MSDISKIEVNNVEYNVKDETARDNASRAVTYTQQSLTDAQKSQARSNIGSGTGDYSKPANGIPSSDMSSGVQSSLNRANALTDAYINGLIDIKLGVIENGTY